MELLFTLVFKEKKDGEYFTHSQIATVVENEVVNTAFDVIKENLNRFSDCELISHSVTKLS